jgi:hypothetical protein
MFSEHVVCHVLCVTCVFCEVVNGKRSVSMCVCVGMSVCVCVGMSACECVNVVSVVLCVCC